MKGLRRNLKRAAFLLSLLVPFYFLFVVLATRFGLFDWRTGYETLTNVWGHHFLVATTSFAAVALLLSLAMPPFGRGWRMCLIALLIPGLGLAYDFYRRQQSAPYPPIHDVTTDLTDPPIFTEDVAEARAPVRCGNGLDLLGARVGELPDADCIRGPLGPLVVDLHREAYPDLQSITLAMPPDRAYAAVLAAARAQNWKINRNDPEVGRLEATQQTTWFGFVDDVVVRVRPLHTGSVVDVRSVSRVRIADEGANAQRIRAFTRALSAATVTAR